MSSATVPTSTKQRDPAHEASQQAAEAAALNFGVLFGTILYYCGHAIWLLGSIAVFGVGIWLVTSFDSSTNNYKGGIAAIVLGGSVVLALTILLLGTCCAVCVGYVAYNKELKKQKNLQKISETTDSSTDNKPADVV